MMRPVWRPKTTRFMIRDFPSARFFLPGFANKGTRPHALITERQAIDLSRDSSTIRRNLETKIEGSRQHLPAIAAPLVLRYLDDEGGAGPIAEVDHLALKRCP